MAEATSNKAQEGTGEAQPPDLGDQGWRIAALQQKERPGLGHLLLSDLLTHVYQTRWRPLSNYPGWQRPWQVLCVVMRFDTLWAAWGYRWKRFYLRWHVPILPRIIDRVLAFGYQVQIGDHVYIGPGLYLAHGCVVMDGFVELGSNCVISPWVTFGLRNSKGGGFSFLGPQVGDGLWVGTHTALLGDITIGDQVSVGAHSLVLDDLPSHCTAAGIPAKVMRKFDETDMALLSRVEEQGFRAR
jgi:serine O-acetyltransferase